MGKGCSGWCSSAHVGAHGCTGGKGRTCMVTIHSAQFPPNTPMLLPLSRPMPESAEATAATLFSVWTLAQRQVIRRLTIESLGTDVTPFGSVRLSWAQGEKGGFGRLPGHRSGTRTPPRSCASQGSCCRRGSSRCGRRARRGRRCPSGRRESRAPPRARRRALRPACSSSRGAPPPPPQAPQTCKPWTWLL